MRFQGALMGLLLLSGAAQATDNPFLKPEKRQPEKPVEAAPAMTMGNGVAVPAVAMPAETAVVGAKLIAVINGEEVWLKNEEKTYIRQKERDDSKIKLQEQVATETSAMPELPVIQAGRPQNNSQ